MKKIFLLLVMAVGTATFTGCSNDDDNGRDIVYYDYPQAFDLNNVNLTYQATTGRYENLTIFNNPLYPSDVILVYRRTVDDGFSVWQQIPRTLYLSNGDEVDYDFNFTRDDFLVFSDANFDLSTAPQFIQNQTFRVVIVPVDDITNARLNIHDMPYEAVAEKYGIKESDVKVLK